MSVILLFILAIGSLVVWQVGSESGYLVAGAVYGTGGWICYEIRESR